MSARILILSMYYWPEPSGNGPYASDLAEHLVTLGHDVTVICGFPHYPRWQIAGGYTGRFSMEERRRGVRIIRRWHYVPQRQSASMRALYEASFMLSAAGPSLNSRVDAVIGIVPSLGGGLLARLTAARARAAYGVIVQDLMGAAARQSGIVGGGAVASTIDRAERWMLCRATVVAPVSDAFRPYLLARGVSPTRIETLPNWSRLEAPTADRGQTRRALGWRDDELVVLHAGNMGLKQGLEQVIDAARVADESMAPVRFVLMGDGNQRSHLRERAAGVTRIEFRPFVSADQLMKVLAAADALLVSERPEVDQMSMPSKLTAYFVAGRPVIAAVNPSGSTAREIQRANAGTVVRAGDPAALVDAVLGMRDMPEAAEQAALRARAHAETALNRDVILARAGDLVAQILQRSRGIRGER